MQAEKAADHRSLNRPITGDKRQNNRTDLGCAVQANFTTRPAEPQSPAQPGRHVMHTRHSTPLTLLAGAAFIVGGAMMACEEAPLTPDAPPVAAAPRGACSPWPACKDDDGGDGGGGDGSTPDSAALDLGGDANADGLGDAMITSATQTLNAEKDDADVLLLNDGGGAFSFDADLNFDDTRAAALADLDGTDGTAPGLDHCSAETRGNRTVAEKRIREAIERFTDTSLDHGDVHPKLSVDKNALGIASSEHRISTTWTEPDGTGWSLGVGDVGKTGNPSTVTVVQGTGIDDDPVTVQYAGGAVGMKNMSANPSYAVICPMHADDAVEAAIDRLPQDGGEG